jgi:O-antigen ligase
MLNMNPSINDNRSNFIYYGLLVYTFLFYTQFAGRYPVFKPFRLEFVLGAIMLIICTMKFFSEDVKLSENKLNSAAIIFFAVLILSIPIAVVKTRALEASIKIFKFFAIYLMIVCSLKSEKELKGFIYLYIIMVCLIFVEPFLLSLQGKGFIYNNHMWRLGGVTGYFAHPNGLGIVTSSNMPFLYYFMVHSRSRALKVLFFCLLLIAFRVIMLTQSRTGMVGALAFLLFVWLKSQRKGIAIFVLIACMVVTWGFAPQDTKDRFLSLGGAMKVMTEGRSGFTSDDEAHRLGSMASRWELMQHALIAFAENPIIGVGINNFISYSGRRWGSWFPPHNTYLQVLAEVGILGFIALFMVIFHTYRSLKQADLLLTNMLSDTRFLRMVHVSVSGHYFVFLIVSIFGIELFSNSWWIAGGLSVVLLRVCNTELPAATALPDSPQQISTLV